MFIIVPDLENTFIPAIKIFSPAEKQKIYTLAI